MAHKLVLAISVLVVTLLAFARAFGQENAPYHYSNCPAPAVCCAVPAPMMTQPVPGGTPTVVTESAVILYGAHVTNENSVIPTPTTPTATPTTLARGTPVPWPVTHLRPGTRMSTGTVKRRIAPRAGFATPVPGTAMALLNTMSVDLRVISDMSAYGDLTRATQELVYLGVRHARTDFTCDQAIWGGGCDPRNLITTFFSGFQNDYWIVLPYTAGNIDPSEITGFQMPNLSFYGLALHALEIGNEANNLQFNYNGVACGNGNPTWAGCANFAADYYNAAVASFPGVPVFSWSNPFAEPDNVLLQYTGAFTPVGSPTLADYADVHNYIQGNGYNGPTDFIVTQAFETGTGGSDNGMTGNFCGNTVTGTFPAVPVAQCPQVPRVTTETGVEFGAPNTTEEARAAMITNAYIIGYIRGWSLVSIYAVADDTTNFGLFQNAVDVGPDTPGNILPYWAATAIRRMTETLSDVYSVAPFTPNTNCPAINGNNAPTDYVVCGQKYDGTNFLIATGDRPQGETVEHWSLAVPVTAQIYDVLNKDLLYFETGNNITVDDHAVIVLWNQPLGTPTPTATATATSTAAPTATPTMSGVPTLVATPTPTPPPPTPTPTPTGGTPTTTPSPMPTIAGWTGARYLQFFDTTTRPQTGTAPIGSASWLIMGQSDRDVDVGDKRGWSFTTGILACCSITQSTFTPSDECGFLLQYYK